MGAPIVAYTSVVGTRLQDHLPLSLLHFLSPTEALFASLQNVLFFSLPFSFYFHIKTLIISKKPGNTGKSRDKDTEFTTHLLHSEGALTRCPFP